MDMDRKGITAYLLITFGITYAVEGLMILSGFRADKTSAGQYIIMLVMWVPAVAAIITTRWVTHEPLKESTWLRFGSWKPYLVTMLLFPLLFPTIYLLTWLLGLGAPDWQLKTFMQMVASSGADMTNAPSPSLIIGIGLIASAVAAPWFNSLLAFGEEWGWRGFLLPRLMPLGKLKAYLLLGVIWGLWHAPLILVGFNYPGTPALGILWMCMFTTALSIFINEMTLQYRSSVLAGWIHGVFNSQAYGIWRQLFPQTPPLWGGFSGLVGIFLYTLLGLAVFKLFNRAEKNAKLPVFQ